MCVCVCVHVCVGGGLLHDFACDVAVAVATVDGSIAGCVNVRDSGVSNGFLSGLVL